MTWLLQLIGSVEKIANQFRDLIRRGIEREVTSVEYVDPSVRHISPIRLRLRQLEREIVFAPDYEQSRLSLTHPRLPPWIRLDGRAVIVEEVALNVRLHGLTEKSEFVGPEIGVVPFHVGIIPDMASARRCQRQKIRAQFGFVFGAIGPERTARSPIRAESLVVRDSVLDDQGLDTIRMRQRH